MCPASSQAPQKLHQVCAVAMIPLLLLQFLGIHMPEYPATLFYTRLNRAGFDGDSGCGQVEDNLTALEVLPKLTPDVLDRIDGVFGTKPQLPAAF